MCQLHHGHVREIETPQGKLNPIDQVPAPKTEATALSGARSRLVIHRTFSDMSLAHPATLRFHGLVGAYARASADETTLAHDSMAPSCSNAVFGCQLGWLTLDVSAHFLID